MKLRIAVQAGEGEYSHLHVQPGRSQVRQRHHLRVALSHRRRPPDHQGRHCRFAACVQRRLRLQQSRIMLLDLRQRGEFTDDMFVTTKAAAAEQVMAVLDQINRKWGRGTLRPAGVPAAQKWAVRR